MYKIKLRNGLAIPESATTSFEFKPTAVNLFVMLARLSNGLGIDVLAPAWLAVRLSLLPSRTLHEGPPDCKYFIIVTFYVYFL